MEGIIVRLRLVKFDTDRYITDESINSLGRQREKPPKLNFSGLLEIGGLPQSFFTSMVTASCQKAHLL